MNFRGWQERRTRERGDKAERCRLRPRDLLAESLAGILQRPGRTMLTALGAILGVGAFVAVLGLTATAAGQISKRFTMLAATEVTVEDLGRRNQAIAMTYFPDDADQRVAIVNGVRSGGVYWPLARDIAETTRGTPLPAVSTGAPVTVLAASPGLLPALNPTIAEGGLFDRLHNDRGEHVAVVGLAAARRLGITTLAAQPAIFIDGIPFTVVGVISEVDRLPDTLSAVLIPRQTAQRLWGPPDRGQEVKMLVSTDLGAAVTVADQVALALRPDATDAFKVTPPPDPSSLREAVGTDFASLFLLLAGVCLVIGAVGIANTTLVAVLERSAEIGLRRALGARPRHIAAQFLTESMTVGTLGGLIGTGLAVVTLVIVAMVKGWTPVIEPWTVLPAPLIGTATGLLAGLYPAQRAARLQPVRALNR